MSGGAVIAPNAPVALTRFARARGIAWDLVLVIALVWAIPALLAVATAVAGLLAAVM
jgi:hypothetical protein